MIRVKIVGACGYGGVGMIELLGRHPSAEIACLADIQNECQPISALYPHLAGFCDKKIVLPSSKEASVPVNVTFMATPDGAGMAMAAAELAMGSKVIDYSGDFRFNSAEAYADYAARIGRNTEHVAPHLLGESVYGLPELHRFELKRGARLVGNPGCFAVSCILGLAPAVKYGAVRLDSLICDCKTGVSGAGKKPSASFHYPARYDNMNAYKLSGHQHVFEIERELGLLAGQAVKITFTAHVVPVCRGIMSTLYADLVPGERPADMVNLYRDFYRDSRFIRLFEADSGVGSAHVRGSNYCNLVVSVDERSNRLRVVSYIDNLVKGQAGSALQNMNLLFDLPEETGLDHPGNYP